jgi:hypothetical protein
MCQLILTISFHAAHIFAGIGKVENANFAHFCVHEFEEVGQMKENQGVIMPYFGYFLRFFLF